MSEENKGSKPKRDYKKLYNTYKKNYDKYYGYNPETKTYKIESYNPKKTFIEFRNSYDTYIKRVEHGDLKTKNITREIIKNQRYLNSKKYVEGIIHSYEFKLTKPLKYKKYKELKKIYGEEYKKIFAKYEKSDSNNLTAYKKRQRFKELKEKLAKSILTKHKDEYENLKKELYNNPNPLPLDQAEFLKQLNNELKKQGKTTKERVKFISQVVFGSPD